MARVLVADDQRDSAEMLAVLLAFVGYDVRPVFDGVSALQTARQWSPDLLLLDERMPGLNGSAVCRALRDDAASRHAPVVLFSCADEYDVDWEKAGATGFLRKPLDLRALPSLVKSLLESEVSASPEGSRAA